jgi:hypothetical protein
MLIGYHASHEQFSPSELLVTKKSFLSELLDFD